MEISHEPITEGRFEARYLAFRETVSGLRPSLHRYCSRMTGSALDGEDVVQEALFQAYRKIESFDENRPLAPWLFRIAHNRCIDFLRHKAVRAGAEAEVAAEAADSVEPAEPAGLALGRAVEHLVLTLPPKERACVLLKDVFDYSLEEIAELVDSTVGGVKAALSRGRSKLAPPPEGVSIAAPARADHLTPDHETRRLLKLYVEGFNRRDWTGLRNLISADARVRVADRFSGRLGDSPYFGQYEKFVMPWRMALGEVDGQTAVLMLRLDGERWVPSSVVRLEFDDGGIATIKEYMHCPWLLSGAASVEVSDMSAS